MVTNATRLERTASARVIRPCMISFYFHPHYSGSAIQAMNLSRRLRALGVDPFIVSANLSDGVAQEQYDGIRVFRLPVIKARELQIPSFAASLWRFLGAHRDHYDVIHAHGTLQHAVAAAAGRRFGKPTILKVAMSGSDIAFARQGKIRGRINRALVRSFDAYIATTEAIVAEFVRQGLDASRVRRIPNGVDTEVFQPVSLARQRELRRELGLPNAPLAIFVGVINGRKNIDGVIRIWRTVCERDSQSHLVLVGPTPDAADVYYRHLRALIHESGLQSRVTFTGFRTPVVPYLQASDAFLFPSHREGMANSVLEAMSCGVPCLVSDAAGLSGVILHGVNGYALPVSDERGFAQTLGRILEDGQLRERVGAAARATVTDAFSLDATAKRYRDLYHQLLTNQRL